MKNIRKSGGQCLSCLKIMTLPWGLHRNILVTCMHDIYSSMKSKVKVKSIVLQYIYKVKKGPNIIPSFFGEKVCYSSMLLLSDRIILYKDRIALLIKQTKKKFASN